jgi:UDP-glucose 4-epimerase
MKILISGAAGYLGSALLEAFPEKDFLVTGYDLLPNIATTKNNFEVIELGAELEIISRISPDIFIHAGAQTSVQFSQSNPIEDAEKNIISSLNILEAITSISPNTHFIYINSGGAIYGASSNFPIEESEKIAPKSFYGISKLTVESYLNVYENTKGLKWSSLALSNLFGPGNRKGIFYEICKKLQANQLPVINGADASRDYIYIDDVVRAVKMQLMKPSLCRLNISSETETTNLEVFRKIAKFFEKTDVQPIINNPIPGEIFRSSLSNKKAKKILGWEPEVELTVGLEHFVKDFIRNAR